MIDQAFSLAYAVAMREAARVEHPCVARVCAHLDSVGLVIDMTFRPDVPQRGFNLTAFGYRVDVAICARLGGYLCRGMRYGTRFDVTGEVMEYAFIEWPVAAVRVVGS